MVDLPTIHELGGVICGSQGIDCSGACTTTALPEPLTPLNQENTANLVARSKIYIRRRVRWGYLSPIQFVCHIFSNNIVSLEIAKFPEHFPFPPSYQITTAWYFLILVNSKKTTIYCVR